MLLFLIFQYTYLFKFCEVDEGSFRNMTLSCQGYFNLVPYAITVTSYSTNQSNNSK